MIMSCFQLPPHGSWKPSINLSSCLTSLQVLMSEPNPDDPLMPEMAEELRYNRDKVSSGLDAITQSANLSASPLTLAANLYIEDISHSK